MSTVFFNTRPGLLAAVDDKVLPFIMHIGLQGWQGPTVIKSLINRAGLSSKANVQFLHSFGGDIYIDTFGHRIGDFSLGGISVPYSCDNTSDISGIEYVLRYYEQFNLVSTGLPVDITLGSTRSFRAYLKGIDAAMANAETMQWSFNMVFALLPYTRPHRSLSNDAPTQAPTTNTGTASTTPPPSTLIGPIAPTATNNFDAYGTGPNLDIISWS